jgi:hypothetical protein
MISTEIVKQNKENTIITKIIEPPKKQEKYTCSICIPHINALPFLEGNISFIRKYSRPEIEYEIIIVDQSKEEIFNKIAEKYEYDKDIKLIRTRHIDCGHAIDIGIKHATKEYFCNLDCDAIPIHKNWLYLPIKLIEKYNYYFVGVDTNLDWAYKDKVAEKFNIFNNYFRVCKTKNIKMLSEKIGFINPTNRIKVNKKPLIESGINWTGPEWADSSVIANWYVDTNKLGDKLALSINKYIGLTLKNGAYGFIIDDLVFHFVFSNIEKFDTEENKKTMLGEQYLAVRNLIEQFGLSQQIIDLIKTLCSGKEGTNREINDELIKPESEIYKYIEELKNS